MNKKASRAYAYRSAPAANPRPTTLIELDLSTQYHVQRDLLRGENDETLSMRFGVAPNNLLMLRAVLQHHAHFTTGASMEQLKTMLPWSPDLPQRRLKLQSKPYREFLNKVLREPRTYCEVLRRAPSGIPVGGLDLWQAAAMVSLLEAFGIHRSHCTLRLVRYDQGLDPRRSQDRAFRALKVGRLVPTIDIDPAIEASSSGQRLMLTVPPTAGWPERSHELVALAAIVVAPLQAQYALWAGLNAVQVYFRVSADLATIECPKCHHHWMGARTSTP